MAEAEAAEQAREQANTGTKEVAESHRFDEASLERWMTGASTMAATTAASPAATAVSLASRGSRRHTKAGSCRRPGNGS